jgi:N-acetylglucosamine kinase-like BadF-type ATPase
LNALGIDVGATTTRAALVDVADGAIARLAASVGAALARIEWFRQVAA